MTDVLILAIWLGLGWWIVFKIHWFNQVFTLEVLNVGGPKWIAFLATVFAIGMWPTGPITTFLFSKWAAKIKGIKVKED